MKTPPTRLREGIDGPSRLIRAINEILAYSIATAFVRSEGGLVRQTTHGTSLRVTRAVETVGGGGGTSRRGIVQQIFGDYYRCSVDGELVYVAKPWRLRRSPFHGQGITFNDEQGRTYTAIYTYDGADGTTSSVRRSVRIETSGSAPYSEFQVVIPRIKVEFDYIDIIGSENGTGVGAAQEFIDLNTDGRAWAREL